MARRYILLTPPYPGEVPGEVLVRCPGCGESPPADELRAHALVCPWCDFHFPLGAASHLEWLADERTFRPLEDGPAGPSLFGRGRLFGRPLSLAVSDPNVPWGAAETHALIALAEESLRERRPLFWVVTAPQGTGSGLPWPGVQAALSNLQEGGLPWIVLLSGPCYGPPASLALQSDLVLAEPGTAMAPLLPGALRRAGRLPLESKAAPRRLLQAGWVDAVLSRQQQRAALAILLDLLGIEGKPLPDFRALWGGAAGPQDHRVLRHLFSPFFELHGDRLAREDPAMVGGLARLRDSGPRLLVLAAGVGSEGCLLSPARGTAVGAAGWRKAVRLLRLAAHFGLAVVTLVGNATLHAGRREPPEALTAALGDTMEAMASLPVPVVAVRLGGGEELAVQSLSTSDRLLAPGSLATHLQEEGSSPDVTFADEEELFSVLGQQLEELTQTYAIQGPLGRRKLLQRRYVRVTRGRD